MITKSISAENSLTVEHTQIKRQKLKYGRFADLVSQSRSVEYASSRYSNSLPDPAAFKRNSNFVLTVRDADFDSSKCFLVTLLCFASVEKEHQASLFCLVK